MSGSILENNVIMSSLDVSERRDKGSRICLLPIFMIIAPMFSGWVFDSEGPSSRVYVS